jgi:alpha-glucosidase (family GH31 glycosyl hydrolase)
MPTPDAGACGIAAEAPISDPPISTPSWAFEPWISKDISTSDDTRGFVDGFISRNIPVGVVVLDSPWETNYNTFVPNPSRYPGFAGLVSELHAKNVRIVLWTTAYVNTSSFDIEMGGDTYPDPHPQFQEGIDCGFYINGGQTEFWWKGTGASVDFFNGQARAWFHKMQDGVLDLGIDGWKLDFGESYIRNVPIATLAGQKTLEEYSQEYYADFFRYARKKRGDQFVTMTRAWDESYQFPGRFFARPEHSPVSWMGDNRRDFIGLADALNETFISANAGYAVVGSDVGGYLDKNDKNLTEDIPYNQNAFSRWVAASALLPLMQLHGRANLTPWTVPIDPAGFTTLYQYWATLHHELVPFFFNLANDARAKKGSPMPVEPIGAATDWPGDFRWVLGRAFLVAPITDDAGIRDVPLPSGSRWYDWWTDANDPIDGGTVVKAYDAKALGKMPLFVREGAIVPANVSSDLTGLGTAASKDALTVMIVPSATPETLIFQDEPTATGVRFDVVRGAQTSIDVSAVPRTTILRVRTDRMPQKVATDISPLLPLADRPSFDSAQEGWFADAARRITWIKLAKSSARKITLQ